MPEAESLFTEAAEKLRRTALEGRSFDTAQIKVIGLDNIRDRVGADWPRIRDRVRTNSSNFLQARLGPDDLVIPCGDGFLIVYTETEGRSLADECEDLRSALSTFYLGEPEASELSAQVTAKTISAVEMIATIGAAAPSTAAAKQTDYKIRFLPIWNVNKEVVSTYIAAPVSAGKDGSRFGYSQEYRFTGRHNDEDFLAIDLEILDRVATEAEKLLASGQRYQLGFSVHASTLQRQSVLRAYRDRLARIPPSVRPYLLARISEIEPGAPAISIAEWVTFLRHFVNRVMLELHWKEQNFRGLDSTRAWAVSCALPAASSLSPQSREKSRILLSKWTAELHRYGLLFLLDNVADPLLLRASCRSNVDFVSGDTFWPIVDAPAGIRMISQLSLMRIMPGSAAAPVHTNDLFQAK